MTIDNEAAKQQLVSTLKGGLAVLLAGAGSSKFVGYPLWGQLVEQMRQRFASRLNWPDDVAPMTFAGTILDEIKKAKQLPAYYNFLERQFEPMQGRTRLHDDLHVALVQMGFCGLVTTTYEPVLESAVTEAFASDVGPFRCEEIDLCQDRVYRVFDFFRGLAKREKPCWVLHLHGYYRNPQGIILTEGDYRKRYGEHPAYDEDGRVRNGPVATSREARTSSTPCTILREELMKFCRAWIHSGGSGRRRRSTASTNSFILTV